MANICRFESFTSKWKHVSHDEIDMMTRNCITYAFPQYELQRLPYLSCRLSDYHIRLIPLLANIGRVFSYPLYSTIYSIFVHFYSSADFNVSI